ncbi:hypothetical protein D5086_005393, partial [Populus alba]
SWSRSNLNNLCEWTAVSCSSTSRTVSQINLRSLNITGTLAHFNFTPFTDLTRFDIQSNNVNGAIPSAIGSLSKLTHLDLSVNLFEGSIPVEISQLTELQYLSLYSNNLNGIIPFQLANLPKLEALNLYNNLFQGPLSSNISKLSNLKNISLQNNLLSGQIPESIGSISGLQIFELFSNSFQGNIPSSIGQLKHLEKLDLRMNALNSTIPPELGLCTNLTYLALADNQLSGELPLSLSNLSKIADMGLSENSLSGEISPTLISNWTELISLQVQNNLFSGNIPPEIGKLTMLQYLFLYNNSFSGSIPPEIGNLKELLSLDLSGNQLSGPLPPTLWNLTNVQTLNLFSNNINGKIPPEVGNLTMLQILDFNTNQLHGELPQTISNIASLTSINLFGNNLSGSIPSDFGKYMPSLAYASFSNNSFSGELPPELCRGLSLQQFTVNSNSFTGSLPTCLRNCSELTRVRLEENRFTGNITDAFEFSKNASARSFAGNSGLCGEGGGLSQCPTTDSSKSKDNKKFLIGVIVPVCGLLVIATIFAVLLCFRKTKLLDEEAKIANNGESSKSVIWERESKFTFGDIVQATDDFNEMYCIGRGGFGSVYKAVLSTGQVVAVKKLNMSDSRDIPATNRQSFENEIKMLTEVRHRNIIKLYGFCSRRGRLYLVYEHVERGSLGKVLYGIEGEAELGWGRRVNTVRGVAHAIAYLHRDCSPPIVHRDISLNNILLETDFEPRLADFGTARLLSTDSSNWTAVAGSYGYMAP